MTLKRNLKQTIRSKRRGVSGHLRLAGQCYTGVTPPLFCRTDCDGHHNALLRRNVLNRLMFRVVVMNDPQGSEREAVDGAGVSGLDSQSFPRFLFGDAVRKERRQTVNLFIASLLK
jgi:hypothetical protein